MAKMLMFFVNDDDKLETILEGFIDIGIRGATILDSMGMGRFLSANHIGFMNLTSLIKGDKTSNKTVIAVTRHPDKAEKAVALIRETMDDFKEPDSGLLVVLPVSRVYGFACPLEDCDE